MLHRTLFVILIFIRLFSPLAASGNEMVFYGAELPPLIHESGDGRLEGFAVDVLCEAVRASGGKIDPSFIKNMPWARALEECRTNPRIALLTLTMLPSREMDYKWVGPIALMHCGLFAMKSSNIVIKRSADFSKYRIGVVRDSAPSHFLFEALDRTVLRLEEVNNIRASIRMMRAGRLDLTVIAEPGFSMLLREMNISGEEFVRVYDLPPLAVYFAFNRHCDDTYISTLRAGLRALYARSADGGSSRYEALCRKYWEPGSNATCAPVAR